MVSLILVFGGIVNITVFLLICVRGGIGIDFGVCVLVLLGKGSFEFVLSLHSCAR